MHTGMLWFDNSKKTLAEKIQKAVEYYHKKYGRKPDLCLVNPSLLEGDADGTSFSSDGLTIRPSRFLLPGHIWIGIEDKS